MRRRGFTIIEVMIVVAIIGIVMAMIAGKIQEHRQSKGKYTVGNSKDAPSRYEIQ